MDSVHDVPRLVWIVPARPLVGRACVDLVPALHGWWRPVPAVTSADAPLDVEYAAVSLVEREDGRILCVWNTRYVGWAMPGGMVESGETAEAAQRRELWEETGVETASAERVFEGEHGIQAAENHGRARRIVLFRVTIKGEPWQMEEGSPIAWKTREEFLAESPFAPMYRRVFAEVPAQAAASLLTPKTVDTSHRVLRMHSGRVLCPTPVFDSYWRFASARQEIFCRRVRGEPPPWTTDPIVAEHRFTNAYRASDRVSQFLIRHVIYDGVQDADEVFFRTLLFKIFNRVDTWKLLTEQLGERPTWAKFDMEAYSRILDTAMANDGRLYSAAYIMPSPPFGHARKHRNHLQLLERMMRDGAPRRVATAASLKEVFEILLAYPSLGDFLAFQFAIDLNYSDFVNFSEMDFVVAGPGARDGIKKCFEPAEGATEAEVIGHMASIADEEFERLGLRFEKLGGSRPLQLIDCQNLFCETDKYARVAHPDVAGTSGRTRIKQKFAANEAPQPQFYPPKWGIQVEWTAPQPSAPHETATAGQTQFLFR